MAIAKWHIGKVLLLWAWGLLLVAIANGFLLKEPHFVVGTGLLAAEAVVFVVLSVITWMWFSGRES